MAKRKPNVPMSLDMNFRRLAVIASIPAKIRQFLFFDTPQFRRKRCFIDGGPFTGVNYWCTMTSVIASHRYNPYPVFVIVHHTNPDVAETACLYKVRRYIQEHPEFGPLQSWFFDVRYQFTERDDYP